jgi:hypothetical protein
MKTIDSLRVRLLLVMLLSITYCLAQEKPVPKIFHLETKDGNGYTGEVISSDSVKVLFKADKLGEITFLKSDVRSMEPVDNKQLKDGKYWLENPQSTRYFFSPNGYGLKKGEGYYQNIWVLMNSFAVGVNDYISLGGGLVPAFLFGEATPTWITAKASIPVVKDKFNLVAGVLAGMALGAIDSGFGIFYGLATAGSKDNNITVGMGYAFASDSGTSSPMFNLNGMVRVGSRGYLLTENYLYINESTTTLVLSFGGRTIIKGAGLDYGLIIPTGTGDPLIAVPWLGITFPFGKKK